MIENLLIGHDAPASVFGFDRSISVPGISVAVGDMVASLRRLAGDAVAGRVSWQLDPAIDRLVSSWPQAFAADRGRALGMTADDRLTISCAPTWLLLPRAGSSSRTRRMEDGDGRMEWRQVKASVSAEEMADLR